MSFCKGRILGFLKIFLRAVTRVSELKVILPESPSVRSYGGTGPRRDRTLVVVVGLVAVLRCDLIFVIFSKRLANQPIRLRGGTPHHSPLARITKHPGA